MPAALTFYDGAGCIGGNKILLEADGTSVWLDFGTNFSAEGRFFDEFLRPRAGCGIGDLLELGLLPPLEGLYRPDLDLPERAWWERMRNRPLYRRVRADGLLLSHAHVDHTGYVTYLDPGIPIVTGLATAVIAKAMQDTAHAAGAGEIAYITPREVKEGLLAAGHYKKVSHVQRPFVLLDEPPPGEGFAAFWANGGSSRALAPRQPAFVPEARIGDLRVRRFPVDHSIPGAGAFAVETSDGWIVYTGDLRLHGARAGDTRAFIREAALLQPIALITEGTHPGKDEPVNEADVYANAAEAVEQAEGLVVADFGPRNVERLLSFLRIARETGRRLGVTARDAYLLEALHAAGDGGVPDPFAEPHLVVYAEAKGNRPLWERALLERHLEAAPERVVAASDVAAAQDEFILCFSYYDIHELIDIQPGGGTYIYSSSEAHNEEMHIDLDRLRAWIRHFGLRFAGEPAGRDGRGGQPGLHASGHIHGPGLVEMVEAIRPQALIAVHTESPDWFRSRFEGRVPLIIPQPGETILLPLPAARAAAPMG